MLPEFIPNETELVPALVPVVFEKKPWLAVIVVPPVVPAFNVVHLTPVEVELNTCPFKPTLLIPSVNTPEIVILPALILLVYVISFVEVS